MTLSHFTNRILAGMAHLKTKFASPHLIFDVIGALQEHVAVGRMALEVGVVAAGAGWTLKLAVLFSAESLRSGNGQSFNEIRM